MRSDLETIFNYTPRTLQNRLKDLAGHGIINSLGERGDVYQVGTGLSDHANKELPGEERTSKPPLMLPGTGVPPDDRKEEIEEIVQLLERKIHLFLSGDARSGKTTLAILLGNYLKQQNRQVIFFELGAEGMAEFMSEMRRFLEHKGFKNVAELQSHKPFMLHTDAAALSGYINQYFDNSTEPVVIIDNLHKIRTSEDLEVLHVMLEYWKSLTFVFTGDKMSNELIFGERARIVEFRIRHKK
jgi:hypothetical protein